MQVLCCSFFLLCFLFSYCSQLRLQSNQPYTPIDDWNYVTFDTQNWSFVPYQNTLQHNDPSRSARGKYRSIYRSNFYECRERP